MVRRVIASRRGQTLEIVDELIPAYDAWVAAREKVTRELTGLILENPNDELIRALIDQEVTAHQQFIAASERANGIT
jgi:hypothetical protein